MTEWNKGPTTQKLIKKFGITTNDTGWVDGESPLPSDPFCPLPLWGKEVDSILRSIKEKNYPFV